MEQVVSDELPYRLRQKADYYLGLVSPRLRLVVADDDRYLAIDHIQVAAARTATVLRAARAHELGRLLWARRGLEDQGSAQYAARRCARTLQTFFGWRQRCWPWAQRAHRVVIMFSCWAKILALELGTTAHNARVLKLSPELMPRPTNASTAQERSLSFRTTTLPARTSSAQTIELRRAAQRDVSVAVSALPRRMAIMMTVQ